MDRMYNNASLLDGSDWNVDEDNDLQMTDSRTRRERKKTKKGKKRRIKPNARPEDLSPEQLKLHAKYTRIYDDKIKESISIIRQTDTDVLENTIQDWDFEMKDYLFTYEPDNPPETIALGVVSNYSVKCCKDTNDVWFADQCLIKLLNRLLHCKDPLCRRILEEYGGERADTYVRILKWTRIKNWIGGLYKTTSVTHRETNGHKRSRKQTHRNEIFTEAFLTKDKKKTDFRDVLFNTITTVYRRMFRVSASLKNKDEVLSTIQGIIDRLASQLPNNNSPSKYGAPSTFGGSTFPTYNSTTTIAGMDDLTSLASQPVVSSSAGMNNWSQPPVRRTSVLPSLAPLMPPQMGPPPTFVAQPTFSDNSDETLLRMFKRENTSLKSENIQLQRELERLSISNRAFQQENADLKFRVNQLQFQLQFARLGVNNTYHNPSSPMPRHDIGSADVSMDAMDGIFSNDMTMDDEDGGHAFNTMTDNPYLIG